MPMKSSYLKDNKIAKDLAIEISRVFSQKRIISFLYFGTRAFGLNTSENSDYDFMLVLDKYTPEDTAKLRKLIQKRPFVDSDINLNLLYLSDLNARGRTNFQIRSLSLSFYKYLEGAKLLTGRNVFKEDPVRLSREKLREMEDFKIQEYYGRCDKLYFQKIADKNLYVQMRKYVKDLVWLLLIRQGLIKVGDLTKSSYGGFLKTAVVNRLISRQTVENFNKLLKSSYSRVNMSSLEKVRRSIYLKYLSLFGSKQ